MPKHRLRDIIVVLPGITGSVLSEADPDGTMRLLSAILWELPSLPGAACIGRHELFDDVAREDPATRAARLAAARRLCRDCPERHRRPTC